MATGEHVGNAQWRMNNEELTETINLDRWVIITDVSLRLPARLCASNESGGRSG